MREGLFIFDALYAWALDLNEGEIAGHERGTILDGAEFLMSQDVDFRYVRLTLTPMRSKLEYWYFLDSFWCHILEKFESDDMKKAISHLHKLYPHSEKDFEKLFSA